MGVQGAGCKSGTCSQVVRIFLHMRRLHSLNRPARALSRAPPPPEFPNLSLSTPSADGAARNADGCATHRAHNKPAWLHDRH